MGESYQDYSWIQNFEADFPQKVSLKMLNKADFNSFSGFFLVNLQAIDHLNLKFWIFSRHTASFMIWVSKGSGFWKFWTFTHANLYLLLVIGSFVLSKKDNFAEIFFFTISKLFAINSAQFMGFQERIKTNYKFCCLGSKVHWRVNWTLFHIAHWPVKCGCNVAPFFPQYFGPFLKKTEQMTWEMLWHSSVYCFVIQNMMLIL